MRQGSNGRVPWVALVALVVLIAGLAAAWTAWRRPRTLPAATSGGADRDVVGEALRGIPPDSTAIKERWIEEPSGIDLAGLDDARRTIFLRHANTRHCTCGCGYTLTGCRASDMECDVSGPRLEALLDSVRTGRIRDARGLRERPPGG